MDRENNQNTNRFFMFVCSLLPGCAHMYLGLMKRGIQLMFSFLLLVGIGFGLRSLSFILVPVVVVLYIYSFFDGYSIFRSIKSGKTVEDEEFIKSHDSLKKLFANGYWIGVLLIVLGTILLLNNFIDDVVFNFIDRQYFYMIMDYVPAALLLTAGVLLMIKGNKERKKLKEQKKDEIKE